MQKHLLIFFLICFMPFGIKAQGLRYKGRFSPAEGLVTPQEKPWREEICLNGLWDFQPCRLPAGWLKGQGKAPDLPAVQDSTWENVPIKIPSPWNVNTWGAGRDVGAGSPSPLAPSSVYYPSYPASWDSVKMGWLRRKFSIPAGWQKKRIVLHFEAVAGEAEVFVNGISAGHHFDSYLPFNLDVSSLVKFNEENVIWVGVRAHELFDQKNTAYPYFSATYPPGSNTDGLAGIWQDVFLQALPEIHVSDVFVKPDVSTQQLLLDIELSNTSNRDQDISLGGLVKDWINKAAKEANRAAEIDWELGRTALQLPRQKLRLKAGESKTVQIRSMIGRKLKYWSPDSPNLYTALIDIQVNGKVCDTKSVRFGWRSFTISGKDFYLNGKKIQAFGDLQHPFGPYICSRRFAWAWYQMIKDAGGNAVRPHAQPWPRVYYDLADEMGLLVLDETALFGSSIRLNFEDSITWQRAADHLRKLVLRDRNHPSVVGWSIGNELFAIALLNKPPAETARRWLGHMQVLARIPQQLDPTRSFITCDGDEDLEGVLPVWSKHFGHGLHTRELPDLQKPMVVGESGATYYGKPRELYDFIGDKAYGSYAERNQALAIDLYQNMTSMANPLLAWFSPSELCWFGIAHLGLGYHDYSRLPNDQDGIFAGQSYHEGQPGYQFERIPPYVTTFNPGLDPGLPLYQPLPMFSAFQLARKVPVTGPEVHSLVPDSVSHVPALPDVAYTAVRLLGNPEGALARLLDSIGISIRPIADSTAVLLIDAADASIQQWDENRPIIQDLLQKGGQVWVFAADSGVVVPIKELVPERLHFFPFTSTALRPDTVCQGKYFRLRDLYFSEMPGDSAIMKYAVDTRGWTEAKPVFSAALTDWSLFNGVAENRKCAQVLLYEHFIKPEAPALITYPCNRASIFLTTLDYRLLNAETLVFWKRLFASSGIAVGQRNTNMPEKEKKTHNLLLDGPPPASQQ